MNVLTGISHTNSRVAFLIAIMFALSLGAVHAVDYDVVVKKKDNKSFDCVIINETIEGVIYTAKKSTTEITLRWKDVKRISYKGMDTKTWKAASEALKNGDYKTAVQKFGRVAEGEETWAQVYGAYNQALAFERDHKPTEAIAAFKQLRERHPKHRMAMYAIFHQGVNVAHTTGGDFSDSIQAIAEWNMDDVGSDIEKALAVLKLATSDMKKAAGKARSLKRRFRSDAGLNFYWNVTWNNIILAKGTKPDGAIRGFEGIYTSMASKPVYRAEASVLLARALVHVGRADEALYYFLHVDALPFVGITLQSEARLGAARILLTRLESTAKGADTEHVEHMKKRAQGLLNAVIEYGINDDHALAAHKLMKQHFP